MNQKITFEKCKLEALKYETRGDFQINSKSIYLKALRKKWLDDICGHMSSKVKPLNYWNYEKCKDAALKVNNLNDFKCQFPGAYNASYKNNWIDEICVHMNKKHQNSRNYWTKVKCQEEALKYNTRNDFIQNKPGVFSKAYKMGWINEICGHMTKNKKTRKSTLRTRYVKNITKEECQQEALKYQTKTEFYKHSQHIYNICRLNKWLNEFFK
jgi:hypothetical protein